MKAKEFDELIESVREGGRILRGEANPSREFTFTQDLLAEMADDAIREDEAGLTEPLDPEKLR